jgi:endoglucanase
MSDMRKEFEQVQDFARRNSLPVNMGEFGSISKAEMPSRVAWTKAMSSFAKKFGYSRHYWEFKAGGFGAYDEEKGAWREELKNAIVQ